jgi:hypothetical protein
MFFKNEFPVGPPTPPIATARYYWSPDSTFADVLPLVVELPAYNPGEYRAGIYKTMSSRRSWSTKKILLENNKDNWRFWLEK